MNGRLTDKNQLTNERNKTKGEKMKEAKYAICYVNGQGNICALTKIVGFQRNVLLLFKNKKDANAVAINEIGELKYWITDISQKQNAIKKEK